MTQLPLIRVGLVERITVRLLSALLGPANAIAPRLDEWERMRFYNIKGRPVVRGGASAEWNLATAHLRCNQRRGTRQVLPVETREEAEKYITAKTGRTAA